MRYLNIFLLFSIILPLNLLAHGYWIELEGDQQPKHPLIIRLIFGEYSLMEKLSGDKLDRMKEIKVAVLLPDGSKQPVEMKQLNDCWLGKFIPQTGGTYAVIGVNDEREVQDWTQHGLGITRPVQYLKAIYTVNTFNEVNTLLFLDILLQQKTNSKVELLLTRQGLPCDTCHLSVVNPRGETEDIQTGRDGKATFTANIPGLYLISVDWIDKNPGTFKNKEYKTIRHRLDYSHQITKAATSFLHPAAPYLCSH